MVWTTPTIHPLATWGQCFLQAVQSVLGNTENEVFSDQNNDTMHSHGNPDYQKKHFQPQKMELSNDNFLKRETVEPTQGWQFCKNPKCTEEFNNDAPPGPICLK